MDINTDDLAKPATRATGNDDIARLIMSCQEQHQIACDQLQLIIDHPDLGIQFGTEEEVKADPKLKIESGTELHRGVCLGITLALQYLGTFPIELRQREDSQEDE